MPFDKPPLRPVVPTPEVVTVEGIVQRHHRNRVGHRGERLVARTSDALRDGVRGDQFRVRYLEGHEFAIQLIPFRIGNLGLVDFVVLTGVVVERGAQFGDALGRRGSV